MKDKSNLLAIVLVIITIIVVVGTMLFSKKSSDEGNDIKIVTNYSNFYTVSSCLYRTITYISNNEKENLLLVLNDSYKNKNSINEENILSAFPTIVQNSTFVAKKMYYETLGNNITKYYVYGYTELEQLFDNSLLTTQDRKEMYFIVYLDSKNKTFSVEPYSGELFMGGESNE